MKFCTSHWDALRAAIENRGLSSLVADNGEKAASNLVSELTEGSSIDNFNAIVANVVAILHAGAAMEVLAGDVCPLCYVNEAHKATCTDDGCALSYDAWVGRAADDMVEAWKKLQV